MRSIHLSKFPFSFAACAALCLGLIGSLTAGVFKQISLEDYMRQGGARAFEGVLSKKMFLPNQEAGREGTFDTFFTLTGSSLHDGKQSQIRFQFVGGTGSDANVYTTTITPHNLNEGDHVVVFLAPTADRTSWRLAAFPMVHHVVDKPTGPVVIGENEHMFVKSNRRLAEIRDEVAATAQRLGIK